MKIKIIALGKIKEKFLKDGIDEFLKRLPPYASVEIIEIPAIEIKDENLICKVLEQEGEKILSHIKPQTFVITLEIKGKMLSSEEFAQKIEELTNDGTSEIATAISGEIGNALLILPDVVLMDHKLYFLSHQRITDQESFSNLKGTITMDNLGFYLSLALSRDEDLKLSVPGYSIEERKPEIALPALIFDAVDNSGYLHLSTKLYLEGFKPGEIENYDLLKAVSIDKDSKTVKIRDIIYPEKTPAEILWALIGRKNNTP